jgi:hypothetical protein
LAGIRPSGRPDMLGPLLEVFPLFAVAHSTGPSRFVKAVSTLGVTAWPR